MSYFGGQISIQQLFSSTFCYHAHGVSLRDRQKQLCKSPRGGWFFSESLRSTLETLLFWVLFRVDQAEDRVKLPEGELAF